MKTSWNLGARGIAVGVGLCAMLSVLGMTVVADDGSEGIEIQDAEGDDYGAGKVKYPTDKLFAAGTLDMTSFRATPYSGGVRFQIEFVTRIPRPPADRKVTNTRYLRELQNNGLFLQNVDIYIDQDGRPDSGQTMTLPGRNADIAPGSGWEKAIILTPQPEAARSILRVADKKLAEDVYFPIDPQLRGKTLVVDVPEESIGAFDPHWGYVVVVTGASFEEAFRMLDPNIRGFGKSIFARIVRPSRDDVYFGGGDHYGLNTNIVDIVLPSGMDQKEMLTPDYEKEQWARLEAVFPNGRPPVSGFAVASVVGSPSPAGSEASGSSAPAMSAGSVAPTSIAAPGGGSTTPIATEPEVMSASAPVEAMPALNGTSASDSPESVPTVPPSGQDRTANAIRSPIASDANPESTRPAPAAPSPPSPPSSAGPPSELPNLTGSVVDFDTGIVVIDLGKGRALQLGRIGRVLDESGQTLVKFVVSELLTDFSVCKIIEGDSSKLRQGLKVELKSGGER